MKTRWQQYCEAVFLCGDFDEDADEPEKEEKRVLTPEEQAEQEKIHRQILDEICDYRRFRSNGKLY